MTRNIFYFIIMLAFISCGKKDKKAENNNEPVKVCNTSYGTIVIDNIEHAITKDTGYVMFPTFYTQHQVAEGLGCTFNFASETYPSGTYTITPHFIDVTSNNGKVYCELFLNGTAFQAQNGTLSILGNGSSATIELCKVNYKNSDGEEHVVSIKTDME